MIRVLLLVFAVLSQSQVIRWCIAAWAREYFRVKFMKCSDGLGPGILAWEEEGIPVVRRKEMIYDMGWGL